MATPTYDLLDSTTIGTSTASVTFSGIDQSYRDLVLVVSGTMNSSATVEFYFNGDTGTSNYSQVNMIGDGTNDSSSAQADRQFVWMGSNQSIAIMQIMDYSATDKHKTTLHRSNNPTNSIVAGSASRWANTAAITSIELDDAGAATFEANTTFYLYGIAS